MPKPNRSGTSRRSAEAPSAAGTRIAKAMAQAGLCSRRDAERWIAAGRVTVNGKIIQSPALNVGPDDKVIVDGKPLAEPELTRLWRYHKPRGLVTTHRDPQGRPTVFDSLPDDLPRVISVGRLDTNTEGLLLLTTDGELARHLELPATGWLRRYRVRAHGRITQDRLDRLKDGIEIDGVRYGPIEASLESTKGANSWLAIGLREGKNREVRNVLASLGLTVNRLIRVSYGPFQLLDLKPGEVEQVKRRVLLDQLGQTNASRFNLGAAAALKARQASGRRPEPRPEISQSQKPARRPAPAKSKAPGRK
jgi:23S rRNA pseudouridine2605 synthase